MIENTPTENVFPWIEAKWVERKITMFIPGGKPYHRYEQQCSNCGYINKSKKRWNSNFCPYCGAKMKGE